jgi:hypothetical protein
VVVLVYWCFPGFTYYPNQKEYGILSGIELDVAGVVEAEMPAGNETTMKRAGSFVI